MFPFNLCKNASVFDPCSRYIYLCSGRLYIGRAAEPLVRHRTTQTNTRTNQRINVESAESEKKAYTQSLQECNSSISTYWCFFFVAPLYALIKWQAPYKNCIRWLAVRCIAALSVATFSQVLAARAYLTKANGKQQHNEKQTYARAHNKQQQQEKKDEKKNNHQESELRDTAS